MSGIGQYLFSVAVTAMICALISSVLTDGAAKGVLRLVCGIVVLLTAFSPLTRIDIPDPESWSRGLLVEGRSVAAMGQELADQQLRKGITERTQSYILDKAAALGLTLEVEVALDEQGLPVSVVLKGRASPYARAQLSRSIQEALVLTKENLRWIGQN